MYRSTEETSRSEHDHYRPFATFSLIWGITALLHLLAFTFWTESWQGWSVVATAIAVIYRPECAGRFMLLVVTSLFFLWSKLPFVPNHTLFEGMLHVTIVLASIGFLIGQRHARTIEPHHGKARFSLLLLVIAGLLKAIYYYVPGVPQGYALGAPTTMLVAYAFGRLAFSLPLVGNGDALLQRFAPVFRIAVVVMYAWAGLQKLNLDYLNPEVSCAAKLHVEIARYFGPFIPTALWSQHAAIWSSYLFEFGIPVLLMIPRTRFVGLVAAIIFHLWLAIHPAAGIFSFSSLILAILILYFPKTWGDELQKIWNGQLRWLGGGEVLTGRIRARRMILGGIFLTIFVQIGLYLIKGRTYDVFFIANRVGFFTFFAWGIWIGGCYLLAGWRGRRQDSTLPNRPLWSLAWLGLIPVLLNGVYPWVGGRTQTSFSMYSNLRSEGEGNHLFLKRVDWLNYQSDMVEVISSEPDIFAPSQKPRGIQQFANPGLSVLPWFEFRRLVSDMEGDVTVRYIRWDEEQTLSREDGVIHGEAEAFTPLPLLKRKFMWFRRLESIDAPMPCTH